MRKIDTEKLIRAYLPVSLVLLVTLTGLTAYLILQHQKTTKTIEKTLSEVYDTQIDIQEANQSVGELRGEIQGVKEDITDSVEYEAQELRMDLL